MPDFDPNNPIPLRQPAGQPSPAAPAQPQAQGVVPAREAPTAGAQAASTQPTQPVEAQPAVSRAGESPVRAEQPQAQQSPATPPQQQPPAPVQPLQPQEVQLSETAASGDPTTNELNELLREMVESEGSDLHLRVGESPIFRIHGNLVRSQRPMLTGEDTTRIMYAIMNQERREHFEDFKELDMSYSVAGLARFRVNVFRQSDVIGAVLRVIPFNIKGFDDLGLPPVTAKLCELQHGLVLVTGPTGSGKSTTLAAMIDYINSRKHSHIITIEDPIEFLHQDKMSTVNQRELGADTHSFADALRHVMRQNPDVILVGELRDLETISQAITAAETGHLVFATLHTTDAAQTIDRVIDVFPPDQQQQVRLQLSTSLAAVVSQTLLPTIDGNARVAAFEILVCHSGVRNIIREGKTHQIYSLIQTGSQYGMQLLDQNLKQLLQQGVVGFDEVVAKSSNPGDFEHLAPN